MGISSRPRKKYVEKPCVLPLGMRSSIKFEMPGYQASIALGQEHFCEQHLYDLLSNADMTRRIAPDGHEILHAAQEMVYAIAEIQERSQILGKILVTGDELKALREGVGKTMDYLRTVSNVQIDRAARAALKEFDKNGVLRV